MELSLKGKKILITGAGAGIGLACAEAFVTAGADVAICDVEQARLDDALASLTAIGGNHYGQLCDVASADAVADFFANSVEALGALDIVLNNAGVGSPLVPLEETDEADYDRLMGINLKGVWLCMRESLKIMSPTGSGHIINMSSIAALTPSPRFSAYVASKSALDAWTKAAAVEYSDLNVRFTTINMPLVRTPMISATTVYDHMPVLTPDEATDMVVDAVIHRPKRIATHLGIFLQVMTAVAPKFSEVLMNTVFRMFNDSAAARGSKQEEQVQVSNEQVALASLMKGVHF